MHQKTAVPRRENQSPPPNAWSSVIKFPLPGHQSKPRSTGLTMVMDKGLGLNAAQDLLDTAGDYIDFIKLGFGTSALFRQELVRQKIELARQAAVDVYPGGTLLEIALSQNQLLPFLQQAASLGFMAIEVSDGTLAYGAALRSDIIKRAVDLGFKVLSEVGKKDPAEKLTLEQQVQMIEADLKDGACRVIIESRESGKGIGLYDQQGNLIQDDFAALRQNVAIDKLLWEAPLKKQQTELIGQLGSNVSLGNIAPEEVIALECLRTGLRGDTFKLALEQVSACPGSRELPAFRSADALRP